MLALLALVARFEYKKYVKYQKQHAMLVQAKFVNHTVTVKFCILMLCTWHNSKQLLEVLHVCTVCEACR